MRLRAKALVVTTAMVATFAILPTFGAAAAEPLDDGSYDVVVGEQTYTVEVVDGTPLVDDLEGVEFDFAFDEETNRVLDEFGLSVDGVEYEVEVAEDGTASVSAEEEEADEESGDDEADDGESDDEADDESDDGSDDDEADDESDDDESEVESLEEDDEADDEDEADDSHGEVVSTVAKCAPNGKEAREAGLPNHGTFVRAAAQGQLVTFEVDGESLEADLSDQAGADAFCTMAEELLAAAQADAEAADAEAESLEDGDGDKPGKGKDKDKGRSGEARGKAKKNG